MESNHGAAKMIDHTDTQTQQLPLQTKRGRGRPKTGTALTPAEKQKAYRERHKGNVTDNSAEIEALKVQIEELKVALGKETAERKKRGRTIVEQAREIQRLIKVTANRDQKTAKTEWDLEYREKGKRTWHRIEGPNFEHRETAEDFVAGRKIDTPERQYRVVEVSLA
jgi:hypothetical protein